MKTALDKDGSVIEAEAEAPKQAVCPHCAGVVTLRQRARSSRPDDVNYFWRHQDHDNAGCPARFAAVTRKNKG